MCWLHKYETKTKARRERNAPSCQSLSERTPWGLDRPWWEGWPTSVPASACHTSLCARLLGTSHSSRPLQSYKLNRNTSPLERIRTAPVTQHVVRKCIFCFKTTPFVMNFKHHSKQLTIANPTSSIELKRRHARFVVKATNWIRKNTSFSRREFLHSSCHPTCCHTTWQERCLLQKNTPYSGMRMRKWKNSWKSAWSGEGGEADRAGGGCGRGASPSPTIGASAIWPSKWCILVDLKTWICRRHGCKANLSAT